MGPAAPPRAALVSGASGPLASPTTGDLVTLTTAGPQGSDSGNYTAVFGNACGEVGARPARATVGDPCAADFNGDGTVNSTDVSDFINAWFGAIAAGC